MHTKSNLVVASRVNTTYRNNLRDGYKVTIPVMTEATDAAVTPGTKPTPVDIAGNTPIEITVDQWRVSAVEISDMAKIEDHVGYLELAAKSCAYRITKRVDTTLGALFSSLGSYSTSAYGADGQTMTDDIILYCMQYLDEGDVPEDDRCIIIDPSDKVDLLKIDKFVRNDYVRDPVVPTGRFGNIYNMGVYVTNNLTAVSSGTGNYGVMMHRDALGLVIQANPRAQLIPIREEFTTLAMVDIIFGVGELRNTFGIPFYTHKA